MKITVMRCNFVIIIVFAAIAAARNNIEKHVQQQIIEGEDRLSSPTKRIYEIYSKVTGAWIQIRGRRIDANGKSGNKYTKLELSSVSLGGVVTIKGVATNRFICMNRRGKLVAKKKSKKSCHFVEKLGDNYYDTFTSVRFRNWLMAFQKNGKPKKGPRTSIAQREVMFMTFLRYPTRENTLSVASPSRDHAAREWKKRIFAQFFANRTNSAKGEVFYNHMMADDPEVLDPASNPPEVQKEIEQRKKIIMEMSQNIKKGGRGKKRGRRKKQASATSTIPSNASEKLSASRRVPKQETTRATGSRTKTSSKSRRQRVKKRKKNKKSFNSESRRTQRGGSSA